MRNFVFHTLKAKKRRNALLANLKTRGERTHEFMEDCEHGY